MITKASSQVIAQLAPSGVLRAGINLSNFLLVVNREPEVEGPSPRMARSIADALGVPLRFVLYETPSEVASAATQNDWDIANIGSEPQRARHIDFSPAYCEIEATYMVRPNSNIKHIDQVDKPGVKVAVKMGSAYGLWLENNIHNADLVPISGTDGQTFETFENDVSFDALAGLRPGLLKVEPNMKGSTILSGQFMSVQQSVGIRKGNEEALAFISELVEEQKKSGSVGGWIKEYGLEGKLSVAPCVQP